MGPYGYIALASLALNGLLLIEARHQYRMFRLADKAHHRVLYMVIQASAPPHVVAGFERDNAKQLKEYGLKEEKTRYDRPC